MRWVSAVMKTECEKCGEYRPCFIEEETFDDKFGVSWTFCKDCYVKVNGRLPDGREIPAEGAGPR